MLLRRRDLLSMLLFAAAVCAATARTLALPDCVLHTMLLMAFIGFWPYLKLLIDKTGDFLKFNGLFIGAIALVVLIGATTVLSQAITPYSTRGGNAVNILKIFPNKIKAWASVAPPTDRMLAEFWNLVIPKFHGGTSDEGIRVPQLNNQQIPAYWGDPTVYAIVWIMGVWWRCWRCSASFLRKDTLVRSISLPHVDGAAALAR